MDENKNSNNQNNEQKFHSSNVGKNYKGVSSYASSTDVEQLMKDISETLDNDRKAKEEAKIEKEKLAKEKAEAEKERLKQEKLKIEKEQNQIETPKKDDVDEESELLKKFENQNLSPEEIERRKQKLAELEKRYNASETVSKSGDGEYKRQFDFSQNLNVKKFKIKPPKKPFIIAFLVGFGLIAIGVLVTFLVLNRPSAPASIQSIELAHTSTESQYIGEQVDLRGINIKCNYSDGTYKYVSATPEMITKMSANITEDRIISNYNAQTYVEFTYENFTTTLYITLNNIYLESIDAEFYGKKSGGQVILYDNILLTGKTTNDEIIKLDELHAEYKINGTSVTTQTGILIPNGLSGEIEIVIYYNHYGEQFTVTKTILVD